MAYSYLIGWKSLDVWYYGVRYATSCEPDDLWKKYFTSSKSVAAFRSVNGDPDVVEVRRIFDSKKSVLLWEETVIRRLGCVGDPRWLNRQNGGRNFSNPGCPRSVECRAKISAKYQERLSDPVWKQKCVERARAASSSETAKGKISEKAKTRFEDKEWKERVHDASHRTSDYRSQASVRQKARLKDPEYVEKHLKSVNNELYRLKQSEDTRRRSQDPNYEAMRSEAMKKALSDPKTRQLMSDRAKASTAKRLETRRLNKLVSAN